jgi:hypothetical protein
LPNSPASTRYGAKGDAWNDQALPALTAPLHDGQCIFADGRQWLAAVRKISAETGRLNSGARPKLCLSSL